MTVKTRLVEPDTSSAIGEGFRIDNVTEGTSLISSSSHLGTYRLDRRTPALGPERWSRFHQLTKDIPVPLSKALQNGSSAP
jgi:hypothetical protein